MTKNEVKDIKDAAKQPGGEGEKSGLPGFFNDTKTEFSKIVWPSRQQLISESAAVLLMVVAVATATYLIDGLFGWVATQVFQ